MSGVAGDKRARTDFIMFQKMSANHLNVMVAEAVRKEGDYWRSLELSSRAESDTDITYRQREEALQWLLGLSDRLQFYPEAFALTVSILDKFLSTVKARPRYLRCIALTCFLLAAKITEEDEMVPTVADLVHLSSARCTADDVTRMERIILNKLSWDINLPTSLGFLQMFHASLMMMCPTLLDATNCPTPSADQMTPSKQLSILTQKLQQHVMDSESCRVRPAVLALSLLSLELEVFRSDWFPLTLSLLKHSKVTFADLIRCREILSMQQVYQTVEAAHHQRVKRKVDDIINEQEDIYDSIKKLYNEETMETVMENEC